MSEDELVAATFGPEKSMGVAGAAKEGLNAFVPGLTLDNILKDVGAELKRLGVQGQMEMASALFGNGGFVPYGPGQYTPAAEKAQEAPEIKVEERGRGGRGL